MGKTGNPPSVFRVKAEFQGRYRRLATGGRLRPVGVPAAGE